MNPDLPADIFTSCLTTPIKIALRWWVTLSYKLSVWNWVLIIKTYFYFQWKYSVLFTSLCEPLFSLFFFMNIAFLCFFYSCYRNYSVLGLTADWTLVVWSPTEGFFSRLCVQTSSEAHPSSCTMGTGVLSLGVKRDQGVTLTTDPHLVPKSRMSRSYIACPPCHLHGSSGTVFRIKCIVLSSVCIFYEKWMHTASESWPIKLLVGEVWGSYGNRYCLCLCTVIPLFHSSYNLFMRQYRSVNIVTG
jgi:hypothetical protein